MGETGLGEGLGVGVLLSLGLGRGGSRGLASDWAGSGLILTVGVVGWEGVALSPSLRLNFWWKSCNS